MTKECIDSVFERTFGLDFEIILVDNGSTDGSKSQFEKDSRITYVYSEFNLGFGCANNLGYKFAKGDYVFLLNSDTILVNNAVYELWNFMRSHSGISISGGQLVDDNMLNIHSYSLILPSLRQELNVLLRGVLVYKNKREFLKSVKEYGYARVAYITGADMMLCRKVIDELGFFDPDFFMYYEETELTYRYMRKGFVSAFYPNAVIKHLVGKSFSFKKERERLFFESRRLYYKKIGYSFPLYSICNIVYFLYLLTSMFNSLLKQDLSNFKFTFLKIKVFCKL